MYQKRFSGPTGTMIKVLFDTISIPYIGYRQNAARVKKQLTILKNHRFDDEWISTFKQNAGIQTLDRPLLAEMVSRIEIHSDKQITVHFRFEDQIQRAIRWLGLFEIEMSPTENVRVST